MLCYFENMKTFFTRKRIIYTSVLSALLIAMILLLIFPIESGKNSALIWDLEYKKVAKHVYDDRICHQIKELLETPFSLKVYYGKPQILVWQTVVFTLLFAAFATCTVLFVRDVLKQYPIKRRPTKRQIMQAQIDALQAQVDELKKDRADK